MKPDRRMLNKMRTKGGTRTKALEKGREGQTIELDDMSPAEYAAHAYVDAISKPIDSMTRQGEQRTSQDGKPIRDEDDK